MGRVRVPKRKGSKWPMTPTPAAQNGLFLWKSCSCISYYLALIPTCIMQPYMVPPIIEGIVSIKKSLPYNFPKMRGGEAVWNFSENSSDLVAPTFPNNQNIYTK